MPTSTSTTTTTTTTSSTTTTSTTAIWDSGDRLFGEVVPLQIPTNVFPFDPDVSFSHGRAWRTQVHAFSPILEQRFVLGSAPLITFDIGFSAAEGDLSDPTSKAFVLWAFYNLCMGRAVPFWYYDPVLWAPSILPYRDDPLTRLASPTPTLGRYIALFDDDTTSAELFLYKLMKAQLKISGVPG